MSKSFAYLFLLVLIVSVQAVASDHSVVASRMEHSVFRDAWLAILNESGIKITLVDVEHEERRKRFVNGQIILDCCSAKIWRERDEEVAVQLWTKPFFYTVDHLILKKDRLYELPPSGGLEPFRVGVVHGFTYPMEATFGVSIVRKSMIEVFQAVAQGEADLTIANQQEFRRLQKKHNWPLVLGPEHGRLFLRARVHNSRPDILERVNHAIERLQASGQIALLTGQRLRR